jgi:hypothetical protein
VMNRPHEYDAWPPNRGWRRLVGGEAGLAGRSARRLLLAVRAVIDTCLEFRPMFFIIEEGTTGRYVQGLVDPDGLLVIETVSNESLGPKWAALGGLDDHDHAELVRLGWHPPDFRSCNWYRTLPENPSAAPLAAEILARTLLDVHHSAQADLRVDFGVAIGKALSAA